MNFNTFREYSHCTTTQKKKNCSVGYSKNLIKAKTFIFRKLFGNGKKQINK